MENEYWKDTPFGENSMFHSSWDEKEKVAKEQQNKGIPKIMNAYLIDYNIYYKNNPLFNNKKKTNTFILVVTFNEQPYKIEATLKGSTKSALRDITTPSSSPYVYMVVYENLISPPFQFQNFIVSIKAYNSYSKEPSDIRDLDVTANLNGKIAVNPVNSKNSSVPINYSIHTIEFHIYASNEIEKWIPKDYDKQAQKGKIKYVYHDINGNLHDIAEVEFHYIQKRKNGCKTVDCKRNGVVISQIPDNYIDTYDYPKGGNAKTAYVYDNGDIYVNGTEYGIVKYPQDTGFVQLIRMPNSLDIKKDNFSINYKFRNSERKYCNPETFAGFIGALAQISKLVLCTGMCFEDATSYPSVTHPNGDSADTAYFSTLEEEQKKVNAFLNFHFINIYRGNNGWFPQLEGTKYSSGHNDHLHAGDFDSNVVKLKIIE